MEQFKYRVDRQVLLNILRVLLPWRYLVYDIIIIIIIILLFVYFFWIMCFFSHVLCL
jgi:hypothetical protein